MKVLLIDEDKNCHLDFERSIKPLGFSCASAATFDEITDPGQFDVIFYNYNSSARLPALKPGTRLIVTAEGPAMEQALREITFPVHAFLIRDPERVFLKTLPAVAGAIDRADKEAEKSHVLCKIIEQTADSLFITNLDGVIEHVNEGFEKLFGYTREEAVGKTPGLLKSGKHNKSFYQTPANYFILNRL
jgi:PAS domain-containing protein